jgi:hypothetical protein
MMVCARGNDSEARTDLVEECASARGLATVVGDLQDIRPKNTWQVGLKLKQLRLDVRSVGLSGPSRCLPLASPVKRNLWSPTTSLTTMEALLLV